MESDLVKNYGKCSKYLTTSKNLKRTLEEYGVAIIPSVISKKEAETMLSEVWDYFEHISQGWETPIKRDEDGTWREFHTLLPLHGMLVQHWQVGHAQASWNLRQNPKVVQIFADLWKVKPEELLVSFDGMSLSPPPETTNRGWHRGTRYHTDQSPTRSGFECVQSWITALDVNKGDATLGFLEKSHSLHGDFAKHFNVTEKGDWYKLKEEETQYYLDNGCKERRMLCKAGDQVFWDSRTIHCGVEPLKGRETPNTRSVIYLCYLPRSLFTKKEIEKRQKIFEELRTTTHKGKMFNKNPRKYPNTVLPTITHLNKPELTELGKKLAGY